MTGVFPSGTTLSVEKISILLIFFVPFLFSLSVHEAAHAWMANRLGDPTARMLGRMTLNPLPHIDWIGTVAFPILAFFTSAPLIGWAKPVPVNDRNLRNRSKGNLLVAAAGPVSNIILALLFTGIVFVLYRVGGEQPGTGTTRSLFNPLFSMAQFGIFLNLILAFFNLIPLPPLDGGHIFGGLFPALEMPLRKLERYGFIVLLVLFMTGMLRWVVFEPAQIVYSYLLRMAV